METTLQMKNELISNIGSINDRGVIMSLTSIVNDFLRKTRHKVMPVKRQRNRIAIDPELLDIVKNIHPLDTDNDKEEYNEYLDKKYK